MTTVKLTEYSHGAGCGCKISPRVLDVILETEHSITPDKNLLVGNQSRDDAAVYDMGTGIGIISTTDFFMPIVDDPFTFGRIAATNAISDVYAMGGTPMMAIAILGWPIDTLAPEIARQVIEGGRAACKDANIQLAGGHSIDSKEPIFGLAVTGSVLLTQLKKNDTAEAGCKLYLTKPLGIGILTTAQKKKLLLPEHTNLAADLMCELNTFGAQVSHLDGVKAMTDVTGFGLLGHLLEMCEGSNLTAVVEYNKLPILSAAIEYLVKGAIPGGTLRNFSSYGHHVNALSDEQMHILCDPQTSGGLLIAITPESEQQLIILAEQANISLQPFGTLIEKADQSFVQVV